MSEASVFARAQSAALAVSLPLMFGAITIAPAHAVPSEQNPLRLPVQTSAYGCAASAEKIMKGKKPLMKLDIVWVRCDIREPGQKAATAKFRCTGNLDPKFRGGVFCESFEPK